MIYKQKIFLVLFLIGAIATISIPILLGQRTQAIPLAGGKTTVFNRTSSAYEQPSAGISQKNFDLHGEGDIAFEAVFVTPPAKINPGLGPLFNNASCVGCHIRNGRGMPEKGQLLVRVSQNPSVTSGKVKNHRGNLEETFPGESALPVPGLGTQIQDQGVYGHPPEAKVEINWQEQTGQYQDGSQYSLRSPSPKIALFNGEPLPDSVMTGLRIPPPVFGLGLLEAVSDRTILDLADPEDKDGDGISGRPNQVWDVEKQSLVLGRFGWKANQPNLLQQTAAAYVDDMGVTNPIFPEADGSSDIDSKTLEVAAFYVQSLAVPGRTLLKDEKVKRGEKLFAAANCNKCHLEELTTGNYFIPALAQQKIHPYTDMLLHDMGPGLADNRPDFDASGTEWRTPPLWGIGLTQTVLPYSSYLHDGRARTLEEAILWHGGEAEMAKQAFVNMSEGERSSLLRFLRSL